MTVDAVLAEVDRGWVPDIAPGLYGRALASARGRRLLVDWLAAEAPAAFAPARGGIAATTLVRVWPRTRLRTLHLQLGALAHAAAVRAVIDRASVLRLRTLLGDGYRMALDANVWPGPADATIVAPQRAALQAALASDQALRRLFGTQGRIELQGWAAGADPALAAWARLLGPPDAVGPGTPLLPGDLVATLVAHHRGPA
ncbi:hypothetical protein [Coralloluteibacterium thermophilus]|uniref:Uncharacterized protein n=1 Tax=Coralloluteibacterium thermophilum TaxID=2707049 RepID=A0ABV9NRI2_9GAMM